MGEWRNKLYYGDNLEVLRTMPSQIVDLVYLDPPFNSARNYNLLFKQHKGQDSPAQIMAFEDTWKWSHLEYQKFCSDERNVPLHKLVASLYDILGDSEMMAYIVMMAPRLLELHRVLKPTGSLYLHCDPTASHYLKLVLDRVFGAEEFRNEIIWQRTNAHNNVAKHFSRLHDVILFYRKTNSFKWHPPRTDFSPEQLKRYRPDPEEEGRLYTGQDLTITGSDGQHGQEEWRGARPPAQRSWAYSHDEREAWFEDGMILLTKDGRPRLDGLKVWLDEKKGKVIGDVWTDIKRVGNKAKERRGYPTQKPLKLLERILASSTDEGDVVLDPFAGCGTAIVQAERMGRRWMGIDITFLAISEILDRLATEKVEGRDLNYELIGTPKDAAGAAALFEQTKPQNHKPYEQFAVSLVRGKWNEKQGADRGIDGRIGMWTIKGEYREAIVQVKGGNALTLSAVRDFRGTIEREKAVMGLIICQKEPTKEMLLEAESAGYADWLPSNHYPRLQIRTMKDLLENPRKPFLFPEGSRIPPQQGVGKAVISGQMAFEDE